MKRRAVALALALGALAGPGPVSGQSLVGSVGLGLPTDPLDAKARALGSFGIGLEGSNLLPSDPAAAAGLGFATGIFAAQPTWVTATAPGGSQQYYRGSRFPLLGVAYPVLSGIVTLHFASAFDQDFVGRRELTVPVAGTNVDAVDSFQQDGAVSTLRLGFARHLFGETAVGFSVGRYTGSIDRSVVRTFADSLLSEPLVPYVASGVWSYSGTLVTAGISAGFADIARLAASATWSSDLKAEGDEFTEGQDRRFDVPLQLRVGGSATLAPGLILVASAARADWSATADDLVDGAGARMSVGYGIGLELSQARLLGREAPLRLGYKRASLPFTPGDDSAHESAFSGGFALRLNETNGVTLATVDLALERGSRSTATFDEDFWRATVSLRLAGF